jgi:hypothetical protein
LISKAVVEWSVWESFVRNSKWRSLSWLVLNDRLFGSTIR